MIFRKCHWVKFYLTHYKIFSKRGAKLQIKGKLVKLESPELDTRYRKLSTIDVDVNQQPYWLLGPIRFVNHSCQASDQNVGFDFTKKQQQKILKVKLY